MPDDEYNAENIVFLDPRVHVRNRPAMYFGYEQWDVVSLHALLRDLIESAAYPIYRNEATKVHVVIMDDHTIRVYDDGRGIPNGPIPDDQEKAWKPFLLRVLKGFLRTGTRTDAYFHTYGFLDYLAGVMSILAEKLTVDTVFAGKATSITTRGGHIVTPLHETTFDETFGTRITYTFDREVFTGAVFEIHRLRPTIHALCNMFPNKRFTLHDLRD